jgi:hypothetical protein
VEKTLPRLKAAIRAELADESKWPTGLAESPDE